MADGETRDIIVTELKKIAEGTRNGKPYRLCQVRATHPDGRVIPSMDLRTFADLPLHQVVRVRVAPFNSPKWGLSYTVWPVEDNGQAQGPPQPQQASPPQQGQQQQRQRRQWTQDRLDALARKVVALERRVQELEGGGQVSEADALEATKRAMGVTAGPPQPTGELPPDPMENTDADDRIPF